MKNLRNITPGEILLQEFLIPLEISQYRLSKDLDIPQTRVSEIIKGNRRISADTAVRLSAYFGNSAKFWLGLQDDYDIENEISEKSNEVKRITRIRKEKNRITIVNIGQGFAAVELDAKRLSSAYRYSASVD
jgi:addiction module HigA family antidote